MLDAVAEGVAGARPDDRLEGVEDCRDRAVALGMDGDLRPGGLRPPDDLLHLPCAVEEHAPTVRRERVLAVDGRRAAAHAAVREDLDCPEPQPVRAEAEQARVERPGGIRLVEHGDHTDRQSAGGVRLHERPKSADPRQVGIHDGRHALGEEQICGLLHEGGPESRPGLGEELRGPRREQREHRCLVDGAIWPTGVVPAQLAERRIVRTVQAGGRESPRIENARMERAVPHDARQVGHGRVQVAARQHAPLPDVRVGEAVTGDPTAWHRPARRLAQSVLDGRDRRRRVGGAVDRGERVRQCCEVRVRIDESRQERRTPEVDDARFGPVRARLQVRERTECDDAVAVDQDRLGSRPAVVHRQDRSACQNQVAMHPAIYIHAVHVRKIRCVRLAVAARLPGPAR